MWRTSWFNDIVLGNESLLAYDVAHSRTMRPVRMGQNAACKHIVSKNRSGRQMTTAAKDG